MKTFGVWCLLLALFAPKISASLRVGNALSPVTQLNAQEAVAAAGDVGIQPYYSSDSRMGTSPGGYVYPPYPPSGNSYYPQPLPQPTNYSLIDFVKNVVWRIITFPFRLFRGVRNILQALFGCRTYPSFTGSGSGGYYPGSSQAYTGTSSSSFTFPTAGYS